MLELPWYAELYNEELRLDETASEGLPSPNDKKNIILSIPPSVHGTGNQPVTMSACSMDSKGYTSSSLATVRLSMPDRRKSRCLTERILCGLGCRKMAIPLPDLPGNL